MDASRAVALEATVPTALRPTEREPSTYRSSVRDDDDALRSFEHDVVLALKAAGFPPAEMHRGRDPFDERRRTLTAGFETDIEHHDAPTMFVRWRPRFGQTSMLGEVRTQHEKYASALSAAGFKVRVVDDRVDVGVEVTRGARESGRSSEKGAGRDDASS